MIFEPENAYLPKKNPIIIPQVACKGIADIARSIAISNDSIPESAENTYSKFSKVAKPSEIVVPISGREANYKAHTKTKQNETSRLSKAVAQNNCS